MALDVSGQNQQALELGSAKTDLLKPPIKDAIVGGGSALSNTRTAIASQGSRATFPKSDANVLNSGPPVVGSVLNTIASGLSGWSWYKKRQAAKAAPQGLPKTLAQKESKDARTTFLSGLPGLAQAGVTGTTQVAKFAGSTLGKAGKALGHFAGPALGIAKGGIDAARGLWGGGRAIASASKLDKLQKAQPAQANGGPNRTAKLAAFAKNRKGMRAGLKLTSGLGGLLTLGGGAALLAGAGPLGWGLAAGGAAAAGLAGLWKLGRGAYKRYQRRKKVSSFYDNELKGDGEPTLDQLYKSRMAGAQDPAGYEAASVGAKLKGGLKRGWNWLTGADIKAKRQLLKEKAGASHELRLLNSREYRRAMLTRNQRKAAKIASGGGPGGDQQAVRGALNIQDGPTGNAQQDEALQKLIERKLKT